MHWFVYLPLSASPWPSQHTSPLGAERCSLLPLLTFTIRPDSAAGMILLSCASDRVSASSFPEGNPGSLLALERFLSGLQLLFILTVGLSSLRFLSFGHTEPLRISGRRSPRPPFS